MRDIAAVTAQINRYRESARYIQQTVPQSISALTEQKIKFPKVGCGPVTMGANGLAVEYIHHIRHAHLMTHSKPIINDPAQENVPSHSIFGLLRASADLLLPERCYSCGDIVGSSNGVCPSCWAKITFITDPCCQHCGRPFEYDVVGEIECGECLRHPPIYEKARACMIYDEGCRSLILAFKHADRVDMAPALAGWLQRSGSDVLATADFIAPVPLHWTRLWSRKFNQSAELARHLALKTGKTYAPEIIRRKRRTPSQAHLRANARAKNVRGAFSVSKKSAFKITGKRILLIDDVMTTGSTLNACAGVLLWAGADAVDVLTLARVVRAD